MQLVLEGELAETEGSLLPVPSLDELFKPVALDMPMVGPEVRQEQLQQSESDWDSEDDGNRTKASAASQAVTETRASALVVLAVDWLLLYPEAAQQFLTSPTALAVLSKLTPALTLVVGAALKTMCSTRARVEALASLPFLGHVVSTMQLGQVEPTTLHALGQCVVLALDRSAMFSPELLKVRWECEKSASSLVWADFPCRSFSTPPLTATRRWRLWL